ncbi:2-succinyl-5-enolpyruvyl-6-hydroxy-3-cyclohexene-1-carboxylic-acid synthase [Arundinibacter roseus]|uniref:2-succinyl-5-enolpyruvyl-6-hydroxy-3-cyclohexene-1-carboxylate synthase n=2 Tax=Arundinibacter roseus TaxID=2070510 RepID=A0A4R4KGT3_9BACT|nr:2-succinyl-5-enolpyruvyl-6-hydroxy-3-cyclohexene-1-carboxylic-acid synthase [Arundinibacter roseus]
MAVLQPLLDLVQLCYEHGVRQAIISPGSRSAALTLAFARHAGIQCTVVMDERSAGFISLGMAQQLQHPVVLVCTSGSAAYNYAPAVTEAFFQHVPLLILTADRPPEWIHQHDGQTIYQSGIFGKHVKESVTLPADYTVEDSRWFINRVVNEALLLTRSAPFGPVHINVPIREPFYPTEDEKAVASPEIRKIERTPTFAQMDRTIWHSILDEWEDSPRILIAVGQMAPDLELNQSLQKITQEFGIPVLGDVISNLSPHEQSIARQDLFLTNDPPKELVPDLLITLGQSFISKNLKLFLRRNPPKQHWHISEDSHIIDTFQTLTKHIPMNPQKFFSQVFEEIDYKRFVQHGENEQEEQFLEAWLSEDRRVRRKMNDYLGNLTLLNEFIAVRFILSNLPQKSILHLGNSMSVRYANFLGIDNEGVEVYCNRGTSGIDGCVSTAIGAAFMTGLPVYLIVGDVSFFYDRNGLMLQTLPDNLRIIVLNNSGGSIFRMIDGPAKQPELETFFETKHSYTAQRTAEDSGLDYLHVDEWTALPKIWETFRSGTKIALLEIKTEAEENVRVMKELKNMVKKN